MLNILDLHKQLLCNMISKIKERAGDPLAAEQLYNIILTAPWLTVGLVFLGLNTSPSLLQTYCCSLWSNNYTKHQLLSESLGRS